MSARTPPPAFRPDRRVLVTGGAGFVGANLAVSLAERHPSWEVIAFDNLHRRGSELNLSRLREARVEFVHGDVRDEDDLREVEGIDAIVECSAEPSVLAGVDSAPSYAVHTNLLGAYNCLELARRECAQLIFLSTSRVYPVAPLTRLGYHEQATRFELDEVQDQPGASGAGISEAFPLAGARTLYGATKLAAELLVEEYATAYGLPAVIDRCGVIAGPWQMGKVDQGVFTYWLASHVLGRRLRYLGFRGSGKQVRDVLHVADLVDLVDEQVGAPHDWFGVLNVGGGPEHALSLRETTELCREITGATVEVDQTGDERPGDIPIYVSDCSRLYAATEWRPRRTPVDVLLDIHAWLTDHRADLQSVLA